MIRTYSLKLDGNKSVSKNFKVREFACNDGSDKILIDDALITIVQAVREHFDKPVHINSAYRTVAYNKEVGGAKNSQHILGKAADIVIKGVAPEEVYQFVKKTFKWAGIGRYDNFTHVDSGPARIFDKRKKK